MIKLYEDISLKEILKVYLSIIIIILLLVISNILLMFHPLTKVLGYEFSAINSLILTVITGVFAINWIKKNGSITSSYLLVVLTFLVIPLIINLIHSFLTEFCSFSDGMLFYLTITAPSILFGTSLAVFITYLFNRFHRLFFFVIIFVIACIPVVEIYYYPQIYFYNPLIGFFPGTIYDEGLTVDLKLIVYRLFNIVFSILILYLVTTDKLYKRKFINTVSVISLGVIFFFVAPYLGFSTTYATLNNLLTGKFETSDYKIHYYNSIPESEAKLLALHTQYYSQLLEESIQEKLTQKIEIFVFNDSEQKKVYFGSGNADVAKPWLYQIYLSRDSWRRTLKHELAHLYSAEFGSTIFKVAGDFNPFLIEGFATAQDPFRENLSIDYLAALAYKYSEESILSRILSHTGFFNLNSLTAYVYAGSFTKFLIANYGIDKFKLYYKTNDITKSYDQSINHLISQFENYISAIPVEENIHSFYYYFGRQSITQRICPRFIAKQLQYGWEHVREGNIEQAKFRFRNILSTTSNYFAVTGLADCLEMQDSLSQSADIYRAYFPAFEKTPFYYLLRLKLADAFTKLNQNDDAKGLYKELSIEKPTIEIELISLLRLKLFESSQLRDYLISNDSVKFSILDELNKAEYFYPSIPSFINLSVSTGSEYRNFIMKFDKTILITDIYSAWAAYKLSEYMLDNFNFRDSRKMAGLSRRYREWPHFNLLWSENFDKAEWFYYNAEQFLNQFKNEVE